jgi:hypothetical protein
MPRVKHLQVVTTDDSTRETTPEQRIFAHWVFMLHKRPTRTALGPSRRRAIKSALELYDEDTLLLAIDGCAASAFHRGDNDRNREFCDLTLILRDEAHIERFAGEGEALHEQAEALERKAAGHAAEVVPITPEQSATPEQIAADRQRLRDLAARLAGKRIAP